MDAIFDLWENIAAFYLPTEIQITTEQAPSTQIKSHSNPNLAGDANKRKTDIRKESASERVQEGEWHGRKQKTRRDGKRGLKGKR